MAEPDLAAMIAAVRHACFDPRVSARTDYHQAALRAAHAVLEALADDEWLGHAIANASALAWPPDNTLAETRKRRADALRDALLARAGGGNG